MQPVPTAPTAAEDGGLSTHVLHMTRLHAKRPLLVELRVINGPFEGGCRLQSGAGAWLACNTSPAPWTASGGRTSPELHIVSSAIAHHGRAKDRQVLLHLPVSLSARQTAHRRLSVAYHDRSQSHRQWLAVTAPAGRADVVERVRPPAAARPVVAKRSMAPALRMPACGAMAAGS